MRLLHARHDPVGQGLLEAKPDPSEAEIRHGIAGNLCRCTGYQFIVTSIQDAAATLAGTGAASTGSPGGDAAAER